MTLIKVPYIDNQAPAISAANMNAIQDEIIANGSDLTSRYKITRIPVGGHIPQILRPVISSSSTPRA